jgi:hypothetical protein
LSEKKASSAAQVGSDTKRVTSCQNTKAARRTERIWYLVRLEVEVQRRNLVSWRTNLTNSSSKQQILSDFKKFFPLSSAFGTSYFFLTNHLNSVIKPPDQPM